MKTFIKLSECQNGFRKGKSPSYNPLIVNEILRVCNTKGSSARPYIGLLTSERPLTHFMSKLRLRGTKGNMAEVLESMYEIAVSC
jgi:hypothetical protein